MAKCIRVVGRGSPAGEPSVPIRMSDDDAFQVVVRDHDGEYCAKSVFKAERLTPYRVERGDNCLRELIGGRTATLHRNLQHSRKSW